MELYFGKEREISSITASDYENFFWDLSKGIKGNNKRNKKNEDGKTEEEILICGKNSCGKYKCSILQLYKFMDKDYEKYKTKIETIQKVSVKDIHKSEREKNFEPIVLTPKQINQLLEYAVLECSERDAGNLTLLCFGALAGLRKGEILGIAGLVSSGRTEILETLFGMRKVESGTISVKGTVVVNNNPRQAKQNKFALLTEERRHNGIFPSLNIEANTTISSIKDYNRLLYIDNTLLNQVTNESIQKLKIKTSGIKSKIKTLSGGNQQKVILGRWLLTKPDILLLDEPTRGIDVGAKYEIYQIINELASNGKGIIVVSSEMPELLGICDRIMVMSNYRVAGILENKNLNQETIMKLASKYI